ncbi:MAG: flagellar biosynthetic protein FliO [Fidelibacterota bacterium]|nr:MAG: flagellar biosynthetic protein FliO [Candidatus Neomarinimicrobiota bacterium]
MARSDARRVTNLILIGVMAVVVVIGFSLQTRSFESRKEQPPAEVTTAAPEEEPAQPVQDPSEKPDQSTTFTTGKDLSTQLWRIVIYVALILGAILVAARIIKRYGGGRLSQASSPEIRILGRRYISPKQSVVIMKVRHKELLLGITDQSIRLLYDFTPEEEERNGTEFA